MMTLNLSWKRCGDDAHYCALKTLELHNLTYRGVYVIWMTELRAQVIRVGQGIIADRLGAHRNDPEILAYGDLRVTWASVPERYLDGVERYLADTWHPRVGDVFPKVAPIAVNPPFAA